MHHRIYTRFLLFFIFIIGLTGCSTRHAAKDFFSNDFRLDTVHAGLFDTGKMWTFDFPPMEYFKTTYHFTPDKDWFEKARLSALRLPNCTAAFVSEDGLVMTNHHCARAALDSVARAGEQLVENGFYASTLEEERYAPNIYIDQLRILEDVTAEVQQAFESGLDDDSKIMQRDTKIKEIQKRYSRQYKETAPQDSMIFNVVSFYNGGRFSVYGYKRYIDVRLVYAPEERMAFFGGDPDNFTYPRYDFDCSFFRIYENGRPIKTNNFFRFSEQGAAEGDAVFVIGNPGRTNRLETVAQLNFRRDLVYPNSIDTFKKLGDVYTAYVAKHPDQRETYINKVFSYTNSRKAITGYLDGLDDPYLMAKKKDFEQNFQKAIRDDSRRKKLYGNLWETIEANQEEMSSLYEEFNALNLQTRLQTEYFLLASKAIDLAQNNNDSIPFIKRFGFYPADFTPDIQVELLAYRLERMKKMLGTKNSALNTLLANRDPERAAKELALTCVFSSREKADAFLAQPSASILASSDPIIRFALAVQPRYQELQKKYGAANKRLQASVQMLGKALYEVYGTTIPPDATFTLRISDGTVKGYEYNGTIAPPITTFYGLYDRYYSFGMQFPWNLPERWLSPHPSFKMNTPMNFVSTNDIIGGNSGSPVINKDLQVVGLIFDGNIESLPGNFIFDETKNRSVSVHSAGILQSLELMYHAERIVKELRGGKIAP